ncbi:bactofilin family protein [Ferruginibacter sp. SUN106]|uniref:bactofilin family protein n=1 Tax=Ferruginibacter sp. SUN106 TaxID=2978348 RepID=UPI003D36541C
MFNSKSKSSFDETPASSTSIIGAGTTITGNVQSNGDIRIDGIIKGNLVAKAKILIGAEGVIEGDIDGKQADILGKVTGKIKVADLLYLHGKAEVDGDIYAGKLQIEPTASFNGQCHMGANVVDLIKITERSSAVNE